MYDRLLKNTVFFSSVFVFFSIVLMLWFQWNKKELLYLDKINDEVQASQSNEEAVFSDTASGFVPIEVNELEQRGKIQIHFPHVLSEKAQLIPDYANKNIILFCENFSLKDMNKCSIRADKSVCAKDMAEIYKYKKDNGYGIKMMIPLADYDIFQIEQEENKVEVVASPIVADKRTTVVLDAGHGGKDAGETFLGMSEKNLNLEIMKQVEQMLPDDIRVFSIRSDDSYAGEKERVEFANAINADLLLSIHYSFMTEETEQKKNGLSVIYNNHYFIPEFGSIEFSDIMAEEVIKKIGGTANAMIPAERNQILVSEAKVPVACIEIEKLVNNENRNSITSEKNMQQIAEGICSGILRARESLQKLQQD